jgi:signal transduction histidine kinase
MFGRLAASDPQTDLQLHGNRLQAENEGLRAKVLEQQQALESLRELFAGLAHEKRNALQCMQACLEMLALEVQDRPEALDLLNRMQAAQDRMHRLDEEALTLPRQ